MSSEKCCFSASLDLGCLLLGIGSFMFFIFITISSTVLLAIGDHHTADHKLNVSEYYHHLRHVININITEAGLNIILGVILLVGLLGIVSSVLLLIGIKKNRSGFVLCYFSFGIVATILCFLAALLEMLQLHWVIAFVQFLLTAIFIHFLVVVHTLYDQMQRGKHCGYNPHHTLEEDFDINE